LTCVDFSSNKSRKKRKILRVLTHQREFLHADIPQIIYPESDGQCDEKAEHMSSVGNTNRYSPYTARPHHDTFEGLHGNKRTRFLLDTKEDDTLHSLEVDADTDANVQNVMKRCSKSPYRNGEISGSKKNGSRNPVRYPFPTVTSPLPSYKKSNHSNCDILTFERLPVVNSKLLRQKSIFGEILHNKKA